MPQTPQTEPVSTSITANSVVAESAARSAGRGGLAVLVAKITFILLGLAQQMALPRAIGLAGFGAFSRVMGPASVLNNVVIASSVQGVSRVVAGAKGCEQEALRGALRVHVGVAITTATGFALLAPALASFQHAQYITLPLILMSGVTFAYALYAPFVGSLNGRGLFGRQAGLDILNAFFRLFAIVGAGAYFVKRGWPPVVGAATGAVLASVCILAVGARWSRFGAPPGKSSAFRIAPRVYLGQLVPIAGAQLFTNLNMQADGFLLGRFVSQGAEAIGLVGDAAAKSADEWMGVYRACQLFSFLPYQLLMSLTQVLFPMLARAKADGDDAAVRLYVARGARIGAVACGLFVAVIAAMPSPLLAFAYGSVVAERGAPTLRILVLGQGAFTMFGIATTVLTSLGKERTAAAASLLALTLVSVLCWLSAPGASFGGAQLAATAAATAVALASAFALSAWIVTRSIGAFVPKLTAVRVALAIAAVATLGSHVAPLSKVLTPFVAGAVGACYIAILFAVGELKRSDLKAIADIAGRRKAS